MSDQEPTPLGSSDTHVADVTFTRCGPAPVPPPLSVPGLTMDGSAPTRITLEVIRHLSGHGVSHGPHHVDLRHLRNAEGEEETLIVAEEADGALVAMGVVTVSLSSG